MWKINYIFLLVIWNVKANPSFQSSNKKTLYTDYIVIQYIYYTRIALGEPYQSFLTEIDLEKNYSCFNSYSYKLNISKTLKNHGVSTVPIENISYYTDYCEDDLRFISINTPGSEISLQNKIKNFPFFLVDYEMGIIRDSFSLNFHTLNSINSTINSLYKNEIIDRRIFYMIPDNETRGKLIFGDISNDYLINNYHKASCKVTNPENSTRWGCTLNEFSLEVEDKVFSTKRGEFSYFITNERDIFAPHSFLGFLNETLLKLEPWKSKCQFGHYYKMNKIKCDCSLLKVPIKMKFAIGRYIFELNQLLENTLGLCFLILRFKPKDTNEWIIGNWFISNYISGFDYDNQEISFYSKQEFKTINIQDISNYIFPIIIINLILLLLTSLLNFYHYYRYIHQK